MKVRNVSGVARGVTPPNAPEFFVEADEVVEVDDALGESLCEQPANWSKATTNKNRQADDSK